MSAQINANVLKNFIIKTIGGDKITQNQSQRFDIEKKEFTEANKDENQYLELDEIMDDTELYKKFATMYVEEQEKDREATDQEREKEEAIKVKDKGQSKA